jgi:hypothetical protein
VAELTLGERPGNIEVLLKRYSKTWDWNFPWWQQTVVVTALDDEDSSRVRTLPVRPLARALNPRDVNGLESAFITSQGR